MVICLKGILSQDIMSGCINRLIQSVMDAAKYNPCIQTVTAYILTKKSRYY